MNMAFIKLENVSVSFPTYENANRSVKNLIIGTKFFGRGKITESGVLALHDLTLKIETGERIGLVGPNGSGKSTLLKVLSGIYAPSAGNLEISGTAASLLDLSSGFDPDASGYENIFLKALLFGKSKDEISKKIEEIVEFSELGDFINLPIRTYSSGMVMRLAFSIATSINPEILLMDEWLSVGDQQFNEKATARLNELVDQASILVIASHNQSLIEELCTRVIHISGGEIDKIDELV